MLKIRPFWRLVDGLLCREGAAELKPCTGGHYLLTLRRVLASEGKRKNVNYLPEVHSGGGSLSAQQLPVPVFLPCCGNNLPAGQPL